MDSKSKLAKVDGTVKTTEAWWSFLDQVWEHRTALFWLVGASSVIGSAIYRAFDFVSQYGWAGWVLALLPATIIFAIILVVLDAVYDRVQTNKIRRASLQPLAAAEPVSTQAFGEERIREIVTEVIAAMPAPASPLPAQPAVHIPPEVLAVTKQYIAEHKADVARGMIKRIDDIIESLRANPNMFLNLSGGLGSVIQGYFRTYPSLGIENVQEGLKEEVSRTIANPKYYVIREGDIFESEEAKQRYHVNIANLSYLRQRAEEATRIAHELTFLQTLNQSA